MTERMKRIAEGLYAALCLLFWLWLGGHVFFPLRPPPGEWSHVFAVVVVFGFTVFSAGGFVFLARMLSEKNDTPLRLALFGLAAFFSLLASTNRKRKITQHTMVTPIDR